MNTSRKNPIQGVKTGNSENQAFISRQNYLTNFYLPSQSSLQSLQNSILYLLKDCPDQSVATRESIVCLLLGKNLTQFALLTPHQLRITQQAMEYRYRILKHQYLGVEPERAYCNLITRLSSLVSVQNKTCTWVALNRAHVLAKVDVLQEALLTLLQTSHYMQQQILWIAKCTSDERLRNALLFANIEEYCLRPIRNQPLLVYFVNGFVSIQEKHFRTGRIRVSNFLSCCIIRIERNESFVLKRFLQQSLSGIKFGSLVATYDSTTWETLFAKCHFNRVIFQKNFGK